MGWVQDVINYITDIVVAVAEDIVVGIRMIIDGVAQVFNAIIKAVEDIAAAIGSFFQMLAKWIEDVLAALSVLFEIIKQLGEGSDRGASHGREECDLEKYPARPRQLL